MIHRALLALATLVTTVLTTSLAAPRTEQPAEGELTLDSIFDGSAAGKTPSRLVWSPDGERLAYAWDTGDGDALWVLDVATGESRRLFELGDLEWAPRDALPTQISGEGYQWSPDGAALLAQFGTDLHLYDLEAEALRQLTETETRESDPRFSPDGTRIAFVRDFDLVLLDLATGEERQVTTGGDGDSTRNGIPDWVYWEEIWGRESRGHWWSPRGDAIAYYHFDDSEVGRYPLSDLLAPYPEVRWQRYPTAGTTNPTVRVGVLRLEDEATTWLDTGSGPDIYLVRVDWAADGSSVHVQRLNRDQTRLELLRCDAGDGGCSVLVTESSPTWVDVSNDYWILADGRIVWPSDRSGWKQLYLYSAEGELLRQLTSASGAVASLEGVDEAAGRVLYGAFGEPPLGAARRQIFQVSIDGGQAEPIAAEPGWNAALVAPRGGHWVHTWSDANHPPRLSVRDEVAAVVAELPSRPPAVSPETLPRWELLTLPGPEGSELPARILLPRELDADASYPALMYQYGGPASQVVIDRWEGTTRGLWHRLMAQRGYVVLSIDNAASTFFGKHGADRKHRRFGELNLAAQRKGAEYLASLPYVDGERLGIWGWSGGGSSTLYALTRAPGVWRAGVAGAPVTDWSFYDTIWTERYLDHPQANPDGYRASSPLTAADELRDRLLIVHGTADDNVHANNTMAFMQALTTAGIPFESAIYARQKHGFRGAAERHLYGRMMEFFDRTLVPPGRKGARGQGPGAGE